LSNVPSLRDLQMQDIDTHCAIFSVLDGDAIIDKAIAATEGVVGDLSQSHTGILLVVPVAPVAGG
jgi:hypothetical protein